MNHPADRVDALAALADLQVAHEELRVAEEELRSQQDQITQLLEQFESERRWRSTLAAGVPVPMCTTDGAGKIISANPALADAVRVPLYRLPGKPLSVFLDPGDVGAFRGAVGALASGQDTDRRVPAVLRGRDGARRAIDLYGFVDVPGTAMSGRVQWVLLLGGAAGDGRGPDPGSVELVAALTELAGLPLSSDDQQALLTRMAVLVQNAVPTTDAVSITLGTPEAPQRLGSDSAAAQRMDGLQLEAAEGPCWQAYATGEVVVTGDVAEDPRWPRLAGVAAGEPVRSVVAVPLVEDGRTTGVLNVYSGREDAFATDGRQVAELIATAVSGVLASAAERQAMRDLAANLEKALTSRAVIDQAKGVLMARLGVSADEAFTRLVALSNRMNVKLRDLARLVVEGHADEVVSAAARH
ncbi:ANTAR domain-containing protein [Geodermatophilus sp. SYSU D00758]